MRVSVFVCVAVAFLVLLEPCSAFCWLLSIFGQAKSSTAPPDLEEPQSTLNVTETTLDTTTTTLNDTTTTLPANVVVDSAAAPDNSTLRLLEFFKKEFLGRQNASISSSLEEENVITDNLVSDRSPKMLITAPERGCNKTNEKRDRRGRCRVVFP